MKLVCSDDRIEAYLERVAIHIKWPPYRARVRRELTDHIRSRAAQLEADEGFSADEAVAQAIRLLGNPDTIGTALVRAYRPYRRVCFMLLSCALWAAIVCCLVLLLLNL